MDRAQVAKRDLKVWERYCEMAKVREIATEFNMSESNVARILSQYRKAMPEVEVVTERARMVDALESKVAVWGEKALTNDKFGALYLKGLERLAKLKGLDAPTESRVSIEVVDERDREIAEMLSETAAAMAVERERAARDS